MTRVITGTRIRTRRRRRSSNIPCSTFAANRDDDRLARSEHPDSRRGRLGKRPGARRAFYAGDYPRSLSLIDAAIAKSPSDVVLHEFCALVLFAMQRYKEAAGTLYAVLSVGPGWDWTTMISLYSDFDVYTRQLQSLENYVKRTPGVCGRPFCPGLPIHESG